MDCDKILESYTQITAEHPELEFTDAAVLQTDQLRIVPEYRRFCEENVCGNYGRNYSCPPSCGTVEEMEQILHRYEEVLVLRSRFLVKNAMDQSEAAPLKKQHNDKARRLLQYLKNTGEQRNYLFISGGPCDLCSPCKQQLGEPCTFENGRASCLSAYSIDVNALAGKAGIPLSWETDQISFFSLIVY